MLRVSRSRRHVRAELFGLIRSLALFAGSGFAALCMTAPALAQDAAATPASTLTSPDGRLAVAVFADQGRPRYRVSFDGVEVIAPSALGLRFADGPDLAEALEPTSAEASSRDETWEQPWGERRFVRDQHNELAVVFANPDEPARGFTLRVRAFDTGIGFRYEVPADSERAGRTLVDELTEFRLSCAAQGGPPGQACAERVTAWSIPAGRWNRYEYLYTRAPLADLAFVHTPVTLKLDDAGPYLALHEAALVDYAAMSIDHRRPGVLKAELAPASDGSKATLTGAFKTPWRTIQIADAAVGLINSDIVLNLNEPNRLGDVSWVKPGKYIGIWWAMHLGQATWGSGPAHGATTANAKRYIDYAAEHGFSGVLIEGWNTGWDGDWFHNGAVFSFTEAYPDFDIEAVTAYGHDKGVRLIGHHETSAHVGNYEAQMDAAFDLYQRLGVSQVKTGYVGDVGGVRRYDADGIVRYERHDGQFQVNHHLRVLEAAAQRKIAINAHEPVKDTGLRRTYPNWLSREGARGMEYNAWGSPPNPPEHEAMLAFTRMLAGPMDFTPGVFRLDHGKGLDAENRVQTTIAKQLALYVVLYSPVQMMAELPEVMSAFPREQAFVSAVPVDWHESRALQGEPGNFVVVARKDRNSPDWWIGAITNQDARDLSIDLDFLDQDGAWTAMLWTDGADADWRANPWPLDVQERSVSKSSTLDLRLAAGGGAAIRLSPKEP